MAQPQFRGSFKPTNPYQYGNFGQQGFNMQPNYGFGGGGGGGGGDMGFDMSAFAQTGANPYLTIGSQMTEGLFKGVGAYFTAREEKKRREEMERRRKQVIAQLQAEMKIPAISMSQVRQAGPFVQRAQAPLRSALAKRLYKRTGGESGVTQGGLTEGSLDMFNQVMSQLYQQMLSANAAKRQSITGNLASVGVY